MQLVGNALVAQDMGKVFVVCPEWILFANDQNDFHAAEVVQDERVTVQKKPGADEPQGAFDSILPRKFEATCRADKNNSLRD
jgi:hypothetical protein